MNHRLLTESVVSFPCRRYDRQHCIRGPTLILAYTLRRTTILIVSLLIAATVLFVLLRLLPGDPANALLGVGATQEQIASARAQVGSDQPLSVQFVSFLG